MPNNRLHKSYLLNINHSKYEHNSHFLSELLAELGPAKEPLLSVRTPPLLMAFSLGVKEVAGGALEPESIYINVMYTTMYTLHTDIDGNGSVCIYASCHVASRNETTMKQEAGRLLPS